MSSSAFRFVSRAIRIKKSLGIRTAAGYLRNSEVSLADALFILVGRKVSA